MAQFEQDLAKEIADLVRRCVEKETNGLRAELMAENAGLQARIARLEILLAEKTARQMSRPLQIGRDLQ